MMSPGGLMRVGVREGERRRGGEEETEGRRDGGTEQSGEGASGNVKLKTRGGVRGALSVMTWGGAESGKFQGVTSIGVAMKASAKSIAIGSTEKVKSTFVVDGFIVLSTEY